MSNKEENLEDEKILEELLNNSTDKNDFKDSTKNEESQNDNKKHAEKNSIKEEKKEQHKKKFEEDNEKLVKMTKEEIIKEYDKLLKDNERLQTFAEEKEKESTEYLDRYRRGLAEVENVRRRLTAEKQDFLKYANFNLVSDLLTILDDFQRAVETANSGNVDFDNYKQGIEMIEKQFIDLLFKKYGVVKFGENGEEFDPNKHQAVMMEEGDFDKEEVLDVFRKGYSLHERIIRPSQVKIGKPKN